MPSTARTDIHAPIGGVDVHAFAAEHGTTGVLRPTSDLVFQTRDNTSSRRRHAAGAAGPAVAVPTRRTGLFDDFPSRTGAAAFLS